MPLLTLSLLIQIIFVVHAHKTGRRDWIWILLVIPVLGCAFYFFLEMLPEIRHSQGGRKAVKTILKTIDPKVELKRAAKALEISDNVQNKLNLADECVTQGLYEEAITLYRSCLTGIYLTDPKTMLSLANTLFLNNNFSEAKVTLDELIRANPDFKSQDGHLLYARTLEGLQQSDEALAEYKVLVSYYSGYEAKCRYALLLKKLGHNEQACFIFQEILKLAGNVSKPYRKVQKAWIDIAKDNLSS